LHSFRSSASFFHVTGKTSFKAKFLRSIEENHFIKLFSKIIRMKNKNTIHNDHFIGLDRNFFASAGMCFEIVNWNFGIATFFQVIQTFGEEFKIKTFRMIKIYSSTIMIKSMRLIYIKTVLVNDRGTISESIF